MSDQVLVNLYFDPYAGLGSLDKEAIVVTDVQSYAAARCAVEQAKSGESRASLTIVVRSPHFQAGFYDLDSLKSLVQVRHITPREEIARTCHITVPDELTDYDLLQLGIHSAADLLAVAGPGGIRDRVSFDHALLAKAFESPISGAAEASDFETWFLALINLLHSDKAPAMPGWGVVYLRNLAEEQIVSALGRFGRSEIQPFVTDLLRRAAEGEAEAFLNQLAVRYWLDTYPKLACRHIVDNLADGVGKWQEIKGEKLALEALAPWCEVFYRQTENPLIDRLEQVLALLLEGSELIEEDDLERYIRRTSGRFAAEYKAAQERLVGALLEQHKAGAVEGQKARFLEHSALLDRHFAPLFERVGQLEKRTTWIKALIEFGDIIGHLNESAPSHWADWLAVYELLIRARQLRREIQQAVGQSIERWDSLQASLATLDERLNSAFADWVLEHYPRIAATPAQQPRLVLSAVRTALDYIARGERVILLVLDALDWELWRSLRAAFAEQGYVTQGEEAGLAVLPTITEFSRRAVFGGLLPRDLASFVDDIYETDIPPQEEAKILARALGYLGRLDQLRILPENRRICYLPGELVYVNGNEQDLRAALSLKAKCYALVYTEIDSYIHISKSVEDKLKETIRQWLMRLVEEIGKGIRENPAFQDVTSLKIIVVSDHGFLDVSEQSQAPLDGSLAFLDTERHGRLVIARVGPDQDMVSAEHAVKESLLRHAAAWNVIWQEQSEQFGLAGGSPSAGRVIAWCMPRLLQYVHKGKGNYVHGGLSMYEAIVPLAVLTKGHLEAEPPVIILSGQLFSEEEGALSITIHNKSARSLQDVRLDIPELEIRQSPVRNIAPGSVEKIVITVVPPASGEMLIHVILEGEISGVRKRFEQSRILTVQPGRRERIRMSTRRILDEW